jgi:phospholipid/cholesterol/gamma-HCH transport system substrate-binding protein
MIRLRHTDEWVGLLVVAACALFLAAVLEAGLLRDWFRPTVVLRIMLPETGVNGLARGADVEVLGIRAGTVRQIVIDPDQRMYAEATIDDQAKTFIRRDSHATIRRRFGVAGSAFIDVSRGTSAQMDWTFAVIDATAEQGPADNIGALITSLRERILPILDDTQRTVASMRAISERIEKGQGTVGRIVTDDTLAQKIEKAVSSLQGEIEKVSAMTDELNAVVKDAHTISMDMAANDSGVPALLRRVNALLASLQSTTKDVAQATSRLPQISRNVEAASGDLPALLTQTQVTLMELEKALAQLQSSWLLGGGAPPSEKRRLPATEIKP